ncbi:hypothetical protein L228DRAFT_257648 [Xylona heveae TC161]|uniref:Telomere-associated protein Rif1 N-terminal domain-containing protein n=1 Tax=Xylona heveae (strain CBS 132557 / TC161) TaxID=1328760 RepID=A0A165JFF7_XYLHT|nr:hypothetical protein L228DRAFT_257648 [Xylona heveae TC161]KZF26166.1 hypothetical protein L228DRAFT_257648 [Xylona heveae TC161]
MIMLESGRPFEGLPPRPPTPPKDSGKLTKQRTLGDSPVKSADLLVHPIAADTPPNNSPSSSSAESATPGKKTKRVGFSPWTDYHQAPSFTGQSFRRETPLRPLPPSRERKSIKSILKPYDRPLPQTSVTGAVEDDGKSPVVQSQDQFSDMLESVVQQLAGEDRNSRLDSYIALSGALKAYDAVPEIKTIKGKMGLLEQFIRRDLTAQSPHDSGTLDTTLVTQALKLVITFIWTPLLCEMLTEEFCLFLIDHAISIVQEAQQPKAVINHYMHLLSQQKFSARIMTTDRVTRLLAALRDIDQRVKGNAIVCERLMVYERLFNQSKSVVVSRVTDWMDHIFVGMLSSIKEIRTRAISFGLQTSMILGTLPSISRVVKATLDQQTERGRFFEYFVERLEAMLASKDDGPHVAQVWSVVVLYLRSRQYQLEHWDHFRAWLHIIQKCFNSNDLLTKFQANLAWNRLVYAINPDTSTAQPMIKMLRQPIIAQLDRKSHDKYAGRTKQGAFSSYCNLLYYSFRPLSPFEQLDLYWEEYVAQIFGKLLLREQQESSQCYRILAAMLEASPAPIWNPERANMLEPVRPEELPRLDAKWVRARVPAIIRIMEMILKGDSWATSIEGDCWSKKIWRGFFRVIGEAGSKEVKVSPELVKALAQVFNLLQKLWITGPQALGCNGQPSDVFIERYAFLVNTVMDHVGSIVFTEKILMRIAQDKFEAALTPSRRLSRDSDPQSPIIHLLSLFSKPQLAIEPSETYFGMLRDLLERCRTSRSSRMLRLSFLRECAQLLHGNWSSSYDSRKALQLWSTVATLARATIEQSNSGSVTDTPQPVGQEYREITKILEVGCGLRDQECFSDWEALFIAFAAVVKKEAGDAAAIISITEPLAHVISTRAFEAENSEILLLCGSLILSSSLKPVDWSSMERSKRTLWGFSPAPKKINELDSFNHLYEMINSLFSSCYENLEKIELHGVAKLISATTEFIRHRPLTWTGILLKRIQNGVALFIEDSKQLLHSQDQVSNQVFQLWLKIAASIRSLQGTDSSLLRALDVLLAAGLQSRRKRIMSVAVDLWNETFGLEDTICYPPLVLKALQQCRVVADLRLPSFPDDVEDLPSRIPVFSESQDDVGGFSSDVDPFRSSPIRPSPTQRRIASRKSQRLSLRSPRVPSSPTKEPPSVQTRSRTLSKGGNSETPASKRRLRHDDSQVDFTPVESSPVPTKSTDSQLLTSRQREVRERQAAETAMFPDFRSGSPAPGSQKKKNGGRRLSLSSQFSTSNQHPLQADDGQMTPTLPPPSDSVANDFLASSPTPRRSEPEQQQTNKDEAVHFDYSTLNFDSDDEELSEPPSSPPPMDDDEFGINEESEDIADVSDDETHLSLARDDDERIGGLETEDDIMNDDFLLAQQISFESGSATLGPSKKSEEPEDDVDHQSDSVESKHDNSANDTSNGDLLSGSDSFWRQVSSNGSAESIEANDLKDKNEASSPSSPRGEQNNNDDVFVDAPQSPIHHLDDDANDASALRHTGAKGNPLVEDADETIESNPPPTILDDISFVENSFCDSKADRSKGPVLQDEIQMQLSNKGQEEAFNMSQQSSHRSSRRGRKRKRRSAVANSGSPEKRSRTNSCDTAVVENKNQNSRRSAVADEELDCIIVSSQLAEDTTSKVKLEQSPLPVTQVELESAARKELIEDEKPNSPSTPKPRRGRKRRRTDTVEAETVADTGKEGVMEPKVKSIKKRKSTRLSQASQGSATEKDASSPDHKENLTQGEQQFTLSVLRSGKGRTRVLDRVEVEHRRSRAGKSPLFIADDEPFDKDGTSITKTNNATSNTGKDPAPQAATEGDDDKQGQVEAENAAPMSFSTKSDVEERSADLVSLEVALAESEADDDTDKTGGQDGSQESGQTIIGGLKKILKDIQRAVLGPQEVRQIDDVLFEVRTEVHEAARRSRGS